MRAGLDLRRAVDRILYVTMCCRIGPELCQWAEACYARAACMENRKTLETGVSFPKKKTAPYRYGAVRYISSLPAYSPVQFTIPGVWAGLGIEDTVPTKMAQVCAACSAACEAVAPQPV